MLVGMAQLAGAHVCALVRRPYHRVRLYREMGLLDQGMSAKINDARKHWALSHRA